MIGDAIRDRQRRHVRTRRTRHSRISSIWSPVLP